MQPTRIVVLNWKDSRHPETGGAETYCENVAAEIAATGDLVTYVTSRPRGTLRREDVNGYRVRRMGGTFTVYPLVLLWLFIHRRKIDAVIDSQNGIPFFSPLALRRRTAITLLIHHVHQEQFALYFPPAMAKVGRWLESTGCRIVYGRRPVCAVSPSTRSHVRRQLGLAGPIYVTPNGYRPQYIGNTEPAETPTISCVGRLVPHKRWELLIDAVAELVHDVPELRVYLIGSGSESTRLQEHIERRGLATHMVLCGYLDVADRDRILSNAWLTVSTSVGEGWGLSIIEAAALGVPAVAVDVPGIRDSVRHGMTGWLCDEPTLVSTLRSALTTLADPLVRDARAQACRSWAQSLRWSTTADRFRAVLAAERSEPGASWDRRRDKSDAVTLVEFGHDAARHVDLRRLRMTDQSTFCPACVDASPGPWRILLGGADEQDALGVIDRLGVPRRHIEEIRLCRSADLIQWHEDCPPHNGLTMKDFDCPRLGSSTQAHPSIGEPR